MRTCDDLRTGRGVVLAKDLVLWLVGIEEEKVCEVVQSGEEEGGEGREGKGGREGEGGRGRRRGRERESGREGEGDHKSRPEGTQQSWKSLQLKVPVPHPTRVQVGESFVTSPELSPF